MMSYEERAALYARCLERDKEVHYSEGWYDTYDYTSASADELGVDVLSGVPEEASLQVHGMSPRDERVGA